MKRWLSVLLVAVLLLTAGCTRSLQGRDRKETEQTQQGSEDETTKPSVREEEENPADTPAPTPAPTPTQSDKANVYLLTQTKFDGAIKEQMAYNTYGDRIQYVVDGEVERIVYEYDSQGNRLNGIVYSGWDNSNIKYTCEYSYTDGRWAETVILDPQGQVIETIYYAYDTKGNRVALQTVQNGTVVQNTEWEYDENGNMIWEYTETEDDYWTVDHVYEDGLLVEYIDAKNGKQQVWDVFKYENGILTGMDVLDESGNVITAYQHTYSGNTCTAVSDNGWELQYVKFRVTPEQAKALLIRYGAFYCFIEQ